MKTDNLERSEQAQNENGAEGSPSSSDKVEVAAAVNNQAQAAAVVDGDDSESCVPFEEDGEVGKEDLSLNDADSKPQLDHQENLEQKTSSKKQVSAIDNILSKTGNAAVDENESDSELSDDDEEENSYNGEEDSEDEDEENLAGEEEDEDSEEEDLAEDEDEDSEEEDLAEDEDEDSEEQDLAEDEDEDSEEEEELDEEALKKADQLLQEMDDAEDPQLEEDDDEDLMEDSDEEERVDAILDKRIRKGKFQYKVKWASADESWENESILGNCKKMLDDFNKQWLEKKRNAKGKNGRAGPGRGYTKEMLGIKPRATNPDSSDSDDSSDEEEAQPPKKITKKK